MCRSVCMEYSHAFYHVKNLGCQERGTKRLLININRIYLYLNFALEASAQKVRICIDKIVWSKSEKVVWGEG